MPRNRPPPLKGINRVWKTLKSGDRVCYCYWGRGPGAVPLGVEGTAAYHERLAAVMRRAPAGGTVAYLIWSYKGSPEFKALRDRTRSDYLKQLDKIQAHFGRLTLDEISARVVIPHIWRWRDSMAGSPRQADYAVQVLKALLSWGERRGLIEDNRAKGVGKLYRNDRRDRSWSEDQISAFLDKAPEPLRRALILALETGQRQADLLVLPWSAVKGDRIELRQRKTGVSVAVSISPTLRAVLDEARATTRSTTILTRADGLPWDRKGNGFRAAWRAACKAAGVSGLTFHDLRGSFITRRLAAGQSAEEVAYQSGHSLRSLASLDAYADRQKIAAASASRSANAARGGEA
jgi:integrase